MSMKNSSDTIGNRTRDLPVCSAVPEPTAPPNTKISWKKTCGKTTAEMGKQHQEALLVAAEYVQYKRMEETPNC
jgi:hypothetical protein